MKGRRRGPGAPGAGAIPRAGGRPGGAPPLMERGAGVARGAPARAEAPSLRMPLQLPRELCSHDSLSDAPPTTTSPSRLKTLLPLLRSGASLLTSTANLSTWSSSDANRHTFISPWVFPFTITPSPSGSAHTGPVCFSIEMLNSRASRSQMATPSKNRIIQQYIRVQHDTCCLIARD